MGSLDCQIAKRKRNTGIGNGCQMDTGDKLKG